MPISGLLLTLNTDSTSLEETIAALRARPELHVGAVCERWLPVAMDAENDEASRNLHDWIASLPAVEFVDVVSVHFDEEKCSALEVLEVQQ
ncbi:MAG: hypothetical protein ACK4UN_10930 [Limisphaerales bacterium]